MATTASCTIRPARASDFDAVADITNHYILTTPIHFSTEPIPADEQRRNWEATRGRYPYLIAESPDGSGGVGGVLGYAKAGVWRNRAAYDWTPEVGLYIHKDHHRRGLGRALYLRLFEIMAAQNYHAAFAGATLPNDASIRLHAELGFESVGIVRQAGWKMGRWWDVEYFRKPLAPADRPARPIEPVEAALARLSG